MSVFRPAGRTSLSVALVTRNRPDSLERALQSWRRQDPQPAEIVVSDDSTPEFEPQTERIALAHGCRYLAGPRRGLYANRNCAATGCGGTHILSADDDHEHPPGFVARILEAIEAEPRTVWCIGEFYGWRDYETNARFNPPGQLNAHGTIQPSPEDPDAPCWSISDGATVYPRGVFDQGLRMYEGVRFGASYCEFGCLLHRFDWRIRPLAQTAVIHHMIERPRSFEDPVEHAASQIFAALMFSFRYQPTLTHKLTSLSKVPVQSWRHRGGATRMLALALRQFRDRSAELQRFESRLDPSSGK
jgi:glycosyltransferase involved in cell wall biosynthesis